jgi:pSer/pThr/pTyr-binding forkhead associated (FHA) protein
MRTWMIGNGEDCDVVVAQPRVSGRHCRLTETADGYVLEDLGSSNGTYVNGERIAAETRVSAADRITLGALVPMPWPPASGVPAATLLRIGRTADNDIVLDDARVSSRHARLIVSGARAMIEDAGSSNGTFLNAPDHRVTRAVPLTAADVVFFGSMAVPAARLLPSRPALIEDVPAPPPLPQPSWAVESVGMPPAVPATAAAVSPWTILVLAQAPLIAILIALAFGRSAAPDADSAASTTFALALAALWLGGTLAVWAARGGGDALGAVLPASPMPRLAAVAGVGAIECAVLLAIVYAGSGLKGSWPSLFGVLVLASAVALSLGWAVLAVIRQPTVAVPVLAFGFLAMIAFGGRVVTLPASSLGAGISVAMPSRWAFEGLLLLESEGRAAPADRANHAGADLAEGFFPTDTERMGPKADAMALAFMVIGLTGAAAFLSANGRPAR